MTLIPDDPRIRCAERTGYGPDIRYREPEEVGWESPEGDFYTDDQAEEAVLMMLHDDPTWVLEALGFSRKERYF